MKLIPVADHPDAAGVLFRLLGERPTEANISHKAMPTWEEHMAFIGRMIPGASKHAYGDWNLIEDEGRIVGAIYVTQADEIGIGIFRRFQRGGLAPLAIKMQMELWGSDRFLANVAPRNTVSRRMFEKLGFKVVQHTLMLEGQ